ncbi:hypothetical protein Tco_0089277 [Tanacetum coccineum]
MVFIVSPWKGVVHFEKKGKLEPRFVGPFEIIENVGPVAYRLDLPEELNGVHDTFHVRGMIHRVKPCVNPAARIPGDATTNFSAAAATTSGGNPQVVYNQVINSPCTENEDPNHTSSSDSNSLHSYRFLIRFVKHAVFYHWRSWERFKDMRLGLHSEPQLRRHVCNLWYEACNSNLLHWRSGMHSEPQLKRCVCNLWYAASNSNLIS